MNLEGLASKVRELSDLELATLLCLVAKQHCLFESEEGLLDDVANELALIASGGFNLSYAVLSLEDYESSEAFCHAILEQHPNSVDRLDESAKTSSNPHLGSRDRFSGVATQGEHLVKPGEANLDTRKLVNVIIAKDFDLAPEGIQIQGLELIHRKRIFSRTTIHTAPGTFLFLPLTSRSHKAPRLNKHLLDRIFVSHYHHPEDGFPNLEEMDANAQSDGQSSPSSVLRKTRNLNSAGNGGIRRFGMEEIDTLRHLSQSTVVSAEVRRYLQDIVVFLRLERGVAGGVSPHATSQFELLTKCLAPLHGLDYVTPSLVALAAKKIYPHRIVICAPEKERSMQYGSDLEAVREVMEGLTPDDVIEAVLNSVQCPL